AGDDRLVADAWAIARVLRLAVRFDPLARALVDGTAGFERGTPLHGRFDLAEHEDPATGETRHVARRLDSQFLRDRRERDWLALEGTSGSGYEPVRRVGLGFVGGIGDHDIHRSVG